MKILFLAFSILVSACSTNQKKDLVEVKKVFSPIQYDAFNGEVLKLETEENIHNNFKSIDCDDQNIPLYKSNNKVVAYLPVSYFSKEKTINCTLKNGKTIFIVKVLKKEYKFEKLSVDKKRVWLNKKDLARVQKEQKVLNKIYASSPARPYFKTGFVKPLDSFITSHYGTGRLFNNKKRSQHLGTDYRAKVGVKIPATNDGKVVLSSNLFYTGNTVIIDHGMNIFTVYGHLSKLNSVKGEFIKKGQILGYSGKSGRVTGPHLHWGVKINGQYINGYSLIEQTK